MTTTKEKIATPANRYLKSSRFVKIDPDQVARFSGTLLSVPDPVFGRPLFLESKQNAYFSFFINSINFCFWAKKDSPKWGIEKDGSFITGYYAFVEAAFRAFRMSKKLWEPDYLAEIGFEEFKNIFAGQGELLLLPERHEMVCENFEILCGYYVGEIERLITVAAGDVNVFVENLTRDFPGFRDQAESRGEILYFYKRAQLLACELFQHGVADFGNLSDLTVFSDYKLPQLLQAEGVLKYDDKLLARVAAEEIIPAGSEEESEIRAATVVACEMILAELKKLGREITSKDLDFLLWVAAKQRQFLLPHHKTVTINY